MTSSLPSSNAAETTRSDSTASQSRSPSSCHTGSVPVRDPGGASARNPSAAHSIRAPSDPSSSAIESALVMSLRELATRLVRHLVAASLDVVGAAARPVRRAAGGRVRGRSARGAGVVVPAEGPEDGSAGGHAPLRYPAQKAPDRRAAGGEEEQQAEDVGDEPGRQQQRPADDHHRPVEGLARRHAALGQREVEAPPRRAALGAQQHRPEDPVEEEQGDGRPHADRPADLDDDVQLDERDDDEQQDQKWHRHKRNPRPAGPGWPYAATAVGAPRASARPGALRPHRALTAKSSRRSKYCSSGDTRTPAGTNRERARVSSNRTRIEK